jgi:hypothetical protein
VPASGRGWLEDENAKLKRLLADAMLDNVALEDPRFAKYFNPNKV